MAAGKRASQGVVLPSPVMVLSVVAVLVAAVVFLTTRGGGEEPEAAVPAGATPTSTVTSDPIPTPTTPPTATPAPEPAPEPEPPAVERDAVFVEVYNNAGITGLADRVGGRASDVGWNVVGTDNWYGTVPTSTVYFPGRLERQADQLATDLGIDRVMPAVGAMKGDRLTVVLTGEV